MAVIRPSETPATAKEATTTAVRVRGVDSARMVDLVEAANQAGARIADLAKVVDRVGDGLSMMGLCGNPISLNVRSCLQITTTEGTRDTPKKMIRVTKLMMIGMKDSANQVLALVPAAEEINYDNVQRNIQSQIPTIFSQLLERFGNFPRSGKLPPKGTLQAITTNGVIFQTVQELVNYDSQPPVASRQGSKS